MSRSFHFCRHHSDDCSTGFLVLRRIEFLFLIFLIKFYQLLLKFHIPHYWSILSQGGSSELSLEYSNLHQRECTGVTIMFWIRIGNRICRVENKTWMMRVLKLLSHKFRVQFQLFLWQVSHPLRCNTGKHSKFLLECHRDMDTTITIKSSTLDAQWSESQHFQHRSMFTFYPQWCVCILFLWAFLAGL